MFFKQLQKQLLVLNRNKTHQKRKKSTSPRNDRNKKKSEQLALEKIEQLIIKRKYKQGLNIVNITIDNGISSQQLLYKKAFLLSRNKQYDEAHAIWSKLSKNKNKPKLAESAKQSLKISKIQKIKFFKRTKFLIDSLHTRADQFQQKLKYLPKSENWSPKDNIVELIRQEAESARKAKLPGLSIYLINQALQAGLKSPELIHDKALTLSMIGKHKESIHTLEELSYKAKNPQLQALISNSTNQIKTSAKLSQSKINILLVKQARAAAESNYLKTRFIPDTEEVSKDINVKDMIFKESRNALNHNNAQASLDIIDALIDFDPENLAALQLKGESLAVLKKYDQARKIWNDLCHSEDKNIAKEASRLLSTNLIEVTLQISSTKSPIEAISHFIKGHLKLNISPALNTKIKTILEQTILSEANISNPDLKQHQLQLMFNTQMIECLEAQLRCRGHLGAITPTQKTGLIRKTTPKQS